MKFRVEISLEDEEGVRIGRGRARRRRREDEPENLLGELSEVKLLVEDREKLSHRLGEMLEVLKRLDDGCLGAWEEERNGTRKVRRGARVGKESRARLTERVVVELDGETDDLVESHLDVGDLHVVLVLSDLVGRSSEASVERSEIWISRAARAEGD